jgi:hypothetical protein
LKLLDTSIKNARAAVIKSKGTISGLAEKLGGCESTIQFWLRPKLKKRVSDYLAGDTGKQKLVDEMLRNVYEPPTVSESVDDMIYYPAPSNNGDYKEAFRAVFKAIGQEAHYAKMSGEGAEGL